MFISPNLSLVVWDLENDDFESSDLANNWIEVDGHDHSPNKGVQIQSAGIADDSIANFHLRNNSVGNINLQDDSVTGRNIAPGSITADEIAPGSLNGAALAFGSVAAAQLDPTLIPLGQVSMFWRPPGTNAVPGGFWELMDGRPWNSIENAWDLTAGNIPDTRGMFPMGADAVGTDGPPIGGTGGSGTADLAHSHNVDLHIHEIFPHTHDMSTNGSHFHTFGGGFSTWLRANSFASGITIYDFNGTQRQNTFYSLYLKNYAPPGDGNVPTTLDTGVAMDLQGDHRHIVTPTIASDTGETATGTDTQLGTTEVMPPFVGFCLMMRVR
jgi:hypothetical protein